LKGIIARTKGYIVLLLAGLVIVTWALALGSRPVSGDKTPVRVMITDGASARVITETLYENRLIRSPLVFLLTCTMGGSSGRLKPGVYEFSQAMNVPEIIRSLVEGDTLESWVTIPEGKTLREMADILQAKQLADPNAFLALTIDSSYGLRGTTFVYGDNLEGYLFPDTYLIERAKTADEIVEMMLATFARKVLQRNRAEIEQVIAKRFGLGEDGFDEGLHKILVIASLVEREARIQADRPKIAAVIWNRLAKNMKLEVDATVTYSLGKSRANKAKVYYKDLANDSPYNTYAHAGLPPAQICNPGLASIEAALEPAAIDALYYVAKKDCSHVFSKTLTEHNAAKQSIKNAGDR